MQRNRVRARFFKKQFRVRTRQNHKIDKMELNRKTATQTKVYPARILQFGEGNFLRAFTDWIVNKMNKETGFNTGISTLR